VGYNMRRDFSKSYFECKHIPSTPSLGVTPSYNPIYHHLQGDKQQNVFQNASFDTETSAAVFTTDIGREQKKVPDLSDIFSPRYCSLSISSFYIGCDT